MSNFTILPVEVNRRKEKDMFTTVRFFYIHGCEYDPMDCTIKEWSSLEKAIAYAHRYATGIRFAGVTVEDEDGKTVYEITSDQEVIDSRK